MRAMVLPQSAFDRHSYVGVDQQANQPLESGKNASTAVVCDDDPG